MRRWPVALLLLWTERAVASTTDSFVEDVIAERLQTNIDRLMQTPFIPLQYTAESHRMGFLSTASTEDVRQMLYEQTLASGAGVSDIDMVYAGLEDGRFVGYFSAESYTYGADSASDPDLRWDPYSLDAIDATCAAAKSCSDGTSTDQTACEAADCSGAACVWGYHPCRKESDWTLAASCPTAERHGSCHAHGTDTADLDEAACALVPHSFWHDPCTVEGCCDSALRIYYATSRAARGEPTSFSRWRLYDPRMRPWYREAISAWHSDQRQMGWSSVYVFSTSQQLGLTAMMTTYDPASGSPDGVFAVDFELATISSIIKDSLSGTADAFAYIVETSEGSSQYGLTKGLIIGSSSDEPVMVSASSLDRLGSCSDGSSADRSTCEAVDCDGNPCVWAECTVSDCRLRATGSQHPAVAASAAALERKGWPANEFVTEGTDAVGWEAYTQTYTGDHGLSWLVVTGISRTCKVCDTWSSKNGACTQCVPVPGQIDCPCCSPGTYNYRQGASSTSCIACDTLAIPTVKPPLSRVTPEALLLPQACPGGLPGEAVVIPYAGLWVHQRADGTPELLACENANACAQGNVSTWITGADGGVCGANYEGFLCRECIDGYAKVAGFCVECDGFNFLMFAQSVLYNFVIAFALLHVSTIAVVSSSEFKQIWYKVDVHETGFLDEDGVIAVLELLGVGDANTIGSELVERLGRDPPYFYSPYQAPRHQGSLTGEALLRTPYCPCTDDESAFYGRGLDHSHAYHHSEHRAKDESVDAEKNEFHDAVTGTPQKLVCVLDFVEEQKKKAPSASVGTAIFFMQTLSLVAKDANWFGVLEALNLDVEKAAGACVSPLSTTSRFIQYIFVTPTILVLSVYIASPLWRWLRNTRCLAKGFEKMQNPRELTAVHRQRALLNVYMFAFFPMIKAAIAVLVCVDTSSETSEAAPKVLAVDYGISCSSLQWWVSACFAVATLVATAVLVPAFLVRKARNSVRLREVDMQLQVLSIDEIFAEMDEDNGGTLEGDEITTLLDKLGYPSDPSAVNQTLEEFNDIPVRLFKEQDVDRSGDLDQEEIHAVLKQMGRELTPEQLQRAFAEMNSDGNGGVELDEFLRWFRKDKMKQMQTDDPAAVAKAVTIGELHAWFRQRIKNTVQTPFDILYGTTVVYAYWWWALVLWLKTYINLIYSWGSNSETSGVSWHIWLHLGLAVFVCISVNTRPYQNVVDFKVELFAVLTLNLVTHIASVYKTGESWDAGAVALTTCLATIPIVGLILLKLHEQAEAKSLRKERLTRWAAWKSTSDEHYLHAADTKQGGLADGGDQREELVQFLPAEPFRDPKLRP